MLAEAAGPEARDELLGLYRTAFGALIAQGAVYVGFGYFRADDGRVSMAALNVFVKDVREANPYLIVQQTVNAHAEGGPQHGPGVSATALELPCGPAAFVIRMTLAPDDVAAVSPAAWQAQAVIPFPQGRKVVVIDLSTPNPTEAPYYAGILDGIAHTVAFTEDRPDGTSAQHHADSRIAQALG